MQWSLIKSWAKDNGYTTFREKTDRVDNPNQYDYYWGKIDDPCATGCAISVSKLATDIYNHITNNQYIEHQMKFKAGLDKQDINHNEFSGQW